MECWIESLFQIVWSTFTYRLDSEAEKLQKKIYSMEALRVPSNEDHYEASENTNIPTEEVRFSFELAF